MTITTFIVAIGTMIFMVYSGLVFDPVLMREQLKRPRVMLSLAQLTVLNFLVVPFAALVLIWMLPSPPGLNLAVLTLAMMPCAPVVPLLVAVAGEPPEWSMFVFLFFSLIGLLLIPVMAQMFPQPWAAGMYAEVTDDTVLRLVTYASLTYFPLLAGIVLRLLAPAPGLRLKNILRPYIGVFSVLVLSSVFATRYHEIRAVNLHDYAVITIFIVLIAALGIVFGPSQPGQPMSSALPTSFRNISLALAFASIVFPHTDTTVYVFAITVVQLVLVFAVIWFIKRQRASLIQGDHR